MIWRIIKNILGLPSPSRIGSLRRPTNWLERWERRVDLECDLAPNDEELIKLEAIRNTYLDGPDNP